MTIAMSDRPFLLDLNVLIALTWPGHVHHGRAQTWFASMGGRWATTPFTEAGFLRLSTNTAVVGEAPSMAEALMLLITMRSVPGHLFIPDSTSLTSATISTAGLVASTQVTDVHLVNLAADSGAVLATLDKAIASYLDPADRHHVRLLP